MSKPESGTFERRMAAFRDTFEPAISDNVSPTVKEVLQQQREKIIYRMFQKMVDTCSNSLNENPEIGEEFLNGFRELIWGEKKRITIPKKIADTVIIDILGLDSNKQITLGKKRESTIMYTALSPFGIVYEIKRENPSGYLYSGQAIYDLSYNLKKLELDDPHLQALISNHKKMVEAHPNRIFPPQRQLF